jgi:hypothetical protein
LGGWNIYTQPKPQRNPTFNPSVSNYAGYSVGEKVTYLVKITISNNRYKSVMQLSGKRLISIVFK